MWKESDQSSANMADSATPVPVSASPPHPSQRVKIRLLRPDGTSRDLTVAGHFREEHLCSLVDDELCRLENGQTLIIHLFHPDPLLANSLRDRWHEGLTDDRYVRVREVLGASGDPNQVTRQLRDIKRRMASGEHVELAIRSPQVAETARQQLRKLLLVSQRLEESRLHIWVYGDERQQQKILDRLEIGGMVRERDFDKFVAEHSDRRWKAPWMDDDGVHTTRRKKKRKHRSGHSSEQAVDAWIKRVEHDREQSHN